VLAGGALPALGHLAGVVQLVLHAGGPQRDESASGHAEAGGLGAVVDVRCYYRSAICPSGVLGALAWSSPGHHRRAGRGPGAKLPSRSVALIGPSRCEVAAARLDWRLSLQIRMSGRAQSSISDAATVTRDRSATLASCGAAQGSRGPARRPGADRRGGCGWHGASRLRGEGLGWPGTIREHVPGLNQQVVHGRPHLEFPCLSV
jgi:hypothetical protein